MESKWYPKGKASRKKGAHLLLKESSEYALHCIHGILEIHVSCVRQLDMDLDLESLRLGFLKLEQPSCTWIWKSTCTCTWKVSYNSCTCTWAVLWFPATRATIILDVAQVWDIKDVHAERNPFFASSSSSLSTSLSSSSSSQSFLSWWRYQMITTVMVTKLFPQSGDWGEWMMTLWCRTTPPCGGSDQRLRKTSRIWHYYQFYYYYYFDLRRYGATTTSLLLLRFGTIAATSTTTSSSGKVRQTGAPKWAEATRGQIDVFPNTGFHLFPKVFCVSFGLKRIGVWDVFCSSDPSYKDIFITLFSTFEL